MTTSPDPIVEAVRERLLQRSILGVKKYGTTLAGNPATRLEWLQHAQDEALDLANYLEKLKAEHRDHDQSLGTGKATIHTMSIREAEREIDRQWLSDKKSILFVASCVLAFFLLLGLL